VEVPEVAERIIEIKAMAREPGFRTKVAVSRRSTRRSTPSAPASACGAAASRTSSTNWAARRSTSSAGTNRAGVDRQRAQARRGRGNLLCFELGRATVVVNEDQLSLAIGKRGQNVRLAARLTGWDVDILTPAEFAKGLDILDAGPRPTQAPSRA
jgi:N utilization substance protein A